MKFLSRINWFAIAAIIFTVAMFVTVLSPVPDFFAIPLGLTAIICAIFNLNWLLERLWLERRINGK